MTDIPDTATKESCQLKFPIWPMNYNLTQLMIGIIPRPLRQAWTAGLSYTHADVFWVVALASVRFVVLVFTDSGS